MLEIFQIVFKKLSKNFLPQNLISSIADHVFTLFLHFLALEEDSDLVIFTGIICPKKLVVINSLLSAVLSFMPVVILKLF